MRTTGAGRPRRHPAAARGARPRLNAGVPLEASTGRLRWRPDQRPRPRRVKWRGRSGHAFVAASVLLLIAFGVVPTGYAVSFAFTNADGRLTGLANFTDAASDFRFGPAIGLWRELAPATLPAIVPVLIVLLFAQRFLVTGMLSGAVKD